MYCRRPKFVHARAYGCATRTTRALGRNTNDNSDLPYLVYRKQTPLHITMCQPGDRNLLRSCSVVRCTETSLECQPTLIETNEHRDRRPRHVDFAAPACCPVMFVCRPAQLVLPLPACEARSAVSLLFCSLRLSLSLRSVESRLRSLCMGALRRAHCGAARLMPGDFPRFCRLIALSLFIFCKLLNL